MKIENLEGKPLDYIKDESSERKNINQEISNDSNENIDLVKADEFVGSLDYDESAKKEPGYISYEELSKLYNEYHESAGENGRSR